MVYRIKSADTEIASDQQYSKRLKEAVAAIHAVAEMSTSRGYHGSILTVVLACRSLMHVDKLGACG